MLLSSSRLSEGLDVRRRRWILWTGFFGLLAAMAIFGWQLLEEVYARGALNSEYGTFGESGWIFNNTFIRDILLKERAHSPDWTEVGFLGFGGVVMSALLFLRSAFYWWPLHPIGYNHHRHRAGALVFDLARVADQTICAQVRWGRRISATDPILYRPLRRAPVHGCLLDRDRSAQRGGRCAITLTRDP
jgi:hypothetical protein